MRKNALLLLALTCLLFACEVGPRYRKPFTHAPEAWKSDTSCSATPYVDHWWEIFQDETLNDLEWQVATNNRSLMIAFHRVFEARAVVQANAAPLYPQASIDPYFTDTGQLFQLLTPSGLSPLIPDNLIYRIHQFQYVLPLNMSYEIDLWGRLKNQYCASKLEAKASEYDLKSIFLTITTDLASNYFQLRSLDTQIEILSRIVQFREKDYQLNQKRYEKGLTNYVNVSNSLFIFSNSKNLLYDAQRVRGLLENLIATLIGVPASEFCLPSNPLLCPPPEIPPGMPSEILLQRPDIAREERKSASEHALVKASYAAFYPSLTLSGTLGYLSPDIRQFLTWQSRFWQIASNASQTVFDGGRKEANLEAQWARFQQASASYQQTVLRAFQEVEDSLKNLEMQAKQFDALETAYQASERNAKLASSRFRGGIIYSQEVYGSNADSLDAQRASMNNLGQRYVSTVQLIKALGGSWKQNQCQNFTTEITEGIEENSS